MNYGLIIPISALLLAEADDARACFPAEVVVCACCAHRGTWYEGSGELSASDAAEITRIRFSRIARTFLTEADSHLAGTYVLSHSVVGRNWEFRFRDTQGKTSAVAFILPASATAFRADMHDGQMGSGGGPLLYKELRFEGTMVGSGIFEYHPRKHRRFRLVLQGRGNNCVRAEDFRNWRLQISADGISHSFYGSLRTPALRARS